MQGFDENSVSKIKFYLSVFSYLLTIILDLLFTYIATPNLLLEGNPLYDALDYSLFNMTEHNQYNVRKE